MSSCSVSDIDDFDTDVTRFILRETDCFEAFNNNKFATYSQASLAAVQTSEYGVSVHNVLTESVQSSHTLPLPITDLCWVESVWEVGEVCCVAVHDVGLTMLWTHPVFLHLKELPGVLSGQESVEGVKCSLLAFSTTYLSLLLTSATSTKAMAWRLGRQHGFVYCCSTLCTNIVHCAEVVDNVLYLAEGDHILFLNLLSGQILKKLELPVACHGSTPTLVLGNVELLVIVDSSDTLHIIPWTEEEGLDPWKAELAYIEHMDDNLANQSKESCSLQLNHVIRGVSWHPTATNPELLIVAVAGSAEYEHGGLILVDLTLMTFGSIFSFKAPSLILSLGPVPLVLDSGSISALLCGLDPDDVLDRLLVYRSAELASSMSAVNSRPTDTITHSSLAHALRYQQIESVNFCLNKAISESCSSSELHNTCEALIAASQGDTKFSKQLASLGVSFISQAVDIFQTDTSLPRYMSELRAVLFQEAGGTFGRMSSMMEEDPSQGIIPPHWDTLSKEEVIRDSVLTGSVGLAEYYLILRDEEAGTEYDICSIHSSSTVNRTAGARAPTNEELFTTSVYHTLVNLLKDKQIILARQVMANMMMCGNSTLKAICLQTDSFDLSSYLISELPETLFSTAELRAHNFLSTLHQYAGSDRPLLTVTHELSLQLEWLVGWSDEQHEAVICERRDIDGDSVGQSDTANTAEIVYSAWRGGECLRSCGLGSIELLYAAPSFSYLPASNQRVIEDRMILSGKCSVSLKRQIEAFLHSADQSDVVTDPLFETELLKQALECGVYSFVVLHLQLQHIREQSIDNSEFTLIQAFINLSMRKDRETMFRVLYLSASRLVSVSPLTTVAMLLYSSTPISQNLVGTEWCHDEALKEDLAKYPKLQNTLYPDTSLPSPAPTVLDVLQSYKEWKSFHLTTPSSLSFSEEELCQAYGRHTTADYTFYLKMSRPIFAFMCLLDDASVMKDSVAQDMYTLAINNANNEKLVASVVIATELLVRDCSRLVVDVQVAKILLHNKYYSLPQPHTVDSVRHDISESKLDKLLPLLKSALRAQGAPARFEGQLLLHLFCQRGSMDIDCHYDNNCDWLDLIWNLHAWQVDRVQARKIISKCNPALRDHMRQVLHCMDTLSHGEVKRLKYQGCCNLFGKIASCLSQSEDGGQALLHLARDIPVAAVIATTFTSCGREEAMVCWLLAKLGRSYNTAITFSSLLPDLNNLKLAVEALTIFYPKSQLLPFLRFCQCLSQAQTPPPLPDMWASHLSKWADPLLPDIDQVKKYITDILGSLVTSADTNYGQFSIVRQLVPYSFHTHLLVPDYGRLLLLGDLLHDTRLTLRLYHEDMETMFLTQSSVHRSIACSLHEEEVSEVLETMLDNGQFDIARKFAVIVGFNTADVILKQMRNQLTRFKDSPLWLTIKARYNFWALTSNRFDLFHTELGEQSTMIRSIFYLLEGCNKELDGIERSYLISKGITALLTTTPCTIGRAQADKLAKFFWTTVAEAYVVSDAPNTSYFEPLHCLQGWERVEVPRKCTSTVLPDYHYQESEQTEEVLRSFVLKFLEAGQLVRAERVCSLFNITCSNMQVVQVCRDLAEDKLTIPLIPAEVLSLVKRKYTVTSPNYLLLDLSTEGRQNSQQTDTHGEGWQEWQHRSDSICNVEEVYVGDMLKSCIKEGSGLCEMYSTLYKMYKEQPVSYTEPTKADQGALLTDLIKYKASFTALQYFVLLTDIPVSKLCPFIAKTVLKLLQSTKESASQIDLDQFKKLAQLAKDHKMLGTLMMDDVVSKTASEHVLKVLLFAYHCFSRACCTEGKKRVLDYCRDRASKFAFAGQCNELVDLLIETEEYKDMMYVCELLYNMNKFHLLLTHPDADKKVHYQTALLAFLEQHHPDDETKRENVCERFNRHIEVARIQHSKAMTIINKCFTKEGDKTQALDWVFDEATQKKVPNVSQAKLEEGVRRLNKAAKHYKLCQAYAMYLDCVKYARLVGLQIILISQKSTVCLMKMGPDEVRNFLNKHHCFFQALIVGQAYNVTDMTPFVFRAAVGGDNMDYFEDYRTVFDLTTTFFEDISVLAQKSRGLGEASTRNIIAILSHCRDLNIRRMIAQRLSLPIFRKQSLPLSQF